MRLSLRGDCTVSRAEEIRDQLLLGLTEADSLELDLSQVSSMDLSFGQLLHALTRSCQARGLKLELYAGLPEELADLAVFCGLPAMAGLPESDVALNIGVVR